MPEPGTEHDELDALAAEFVERCRRGDCPSVSEYATNHPELAAEIRDLFPTIAAMERLKTRRQMSRGGRASLGGVRLERLGDFRIIREIGRGGMGIVYEAEQESLGRHVAVKVLPQSALLNLQQLQRFQREAQTAAGLHHTNIVPVFGVGEHQGFHYIVMQLIHGVGLDQVLLCLAENSGRDSIESASRSVGRQTGEGATEVAAVTCALVGGESQPHRPSVGSPGRQTDGEPCGEEAGAVKAGRVGPRYWQNVARIGVQVADALQYAHERGTLHRDIKPANLLVDLQGVVWVTDFGLARAMEHGAASQSGEIVGTLRYMAPERFRGQADVRSDIYSLGLTLYELLTLQPAYAHCNPSALMRKIADEQPVCPRVLNREIPRDLETIVVKAIAREPAQRYPSAEALAHDLQCFLEDRPIRARRTSVVERLWRWSRRNRAVAGLTGIAVALLILVAVVATVGYVRTSNANIQVRDALAGESSQRRKAEATSELALEALDSIFEQFSPNRVSAASELALDNSPDSEIRVSVQPVLSKEAAALLEHMLVFYDRLAEHGADDARLRRKVADANRRVGDIRRRLGHFERAQAAYFKAIEGYEQLQQDSPDDTAIPLEIARIYNELGNLHWTARWPGEGRPFHLKAIAALGGAPSVSASSLKSRYELARTHYFLGRGGPPDTAPGPRPPGSAPPRPSPDRRGPSAGASRKGAGPPPQEAIRRDNEANLQQAIKLLDSLIDQYPSIPDYRHLLACCYRDLPSGGPSSGRRSVFGATDKAIEILQKLVDDFPDVPDYRYDLAKTYARVDFRDPQFQVDLYPIAEERLRKALSISEKLVAEHPNVPDYAASEVQIYFALAELLRHAGQPDDAQANLQKALAIQSSLVDRFPDVLPYKAWMAILRESLARLWYNRGHSEQARAILQYSIDALNRSLETDPQAGYLHGLLARSYTSLADVLTQLGEEQSAADMLRRAEAHRLDRYPD